MCNSTCYHFLIVYVCQGEARNFMYILTLNATSQPNPIRQILFSTTDEDAEAQRNQAECLELYP